MDKLYTGVPFLISYLLYDVYNGGRPTRATFSVISKFTFIYMQTYFSNIHKQTLVWFSIAVFAVMFTAMPLQQAHAVESTPVSSTALLQAKLKEALAQITQLRLKLAEIETGSSQAGVVASSVVTNKVASTDLFDFKAEPFRDFDRVNVSFTRGSSCSPYTINWGDGKQDVVKGGSNCPQVTVKVETAHLYGKAGTYTVSLTQGDKTVSKQVVVIPKYKDTPIGFGSVLGASTHNAQAQLDAVVIEYARLSALVAELE